MPAAERLSVAHHVDIATAFELALTGAMDGRIVNIADEAPPSLYEMAQIKGQVVVTFLAILEMTRLKMVRLTQADLLSAIYITKAGADLKLQAEALRDRPEEYKE